VTRLVTRLAVLIGSCAGFGSQAPENPCQVLHQAIRRPKLGAVRAQRAFRTGPIVYMRTMSMAASTAAIVLTSTTHSTGMVPVRLPGRLKIGYIVRRHHRPIQIQTGPNHHRRRSHARLSSAEYSVTCTATQVLTWALTW
jgi:hypothetical protein